MSPRSRTRRKNRPHVQQAAPAERKGLMRRALTSAAAGWALCALVAAAHGILAELAPYQASTVAVVYPALIVAPGLVSMLLLPGEWKHFYRWGTILFLALCCFPDVAPVAVAVGTCWSLHRAWFTERTGPILLQRPRKARTAAAKAA